MFDMKYDRDGNPIKTSIPTTGAPVVEIKKESVVESLADTHEESAPIEATETESQDNSQEVPAPEPQPAPVLQADPKQSFKELRVQKEKAERERDDLMRRLQEIEYQKQLSAKPAPPQQASEEDSDFTLGPDDIAEGKHLSKVQRHVKKLEEQIKQFQSQSTTLTAEAKLRAQYPDFDTVVSKDNIDTFRETYPELAQTLTSSNDLYSKAVSAYTLIKKLGIAQNPAQYTQDVERAKTNAAKPRPLTSISPQQGDTPLSRANAFANGELTEDMKTQLLKEMHAARRGL
jgi:hypothetical protein